MPILQENALYEVLVPHLGKDTFILMSIEGSEYVSNTFCFNITMATVESSIDDEALIRKPILVTLRRPGEDPRLIHAWIQKTKRLGYEQGEEIIYFWQATIVPWMWFLNLEIDCRHFINMDAVQIIKKVFDDHGYSNYTFKTQGGFPKREFTVQYRESSFNFVSRLLEEEGIFYWFEHSEGKHQLILTNANSVTQNCPGTYKLPYNKGTSSGMASGVIDSIESDVSVHTGKLSFQDYDFEKSSVNLFTTSKGNQLAEVYDYPGLYKNKADGERYIKLRLEEQEARLRTIQSHTAVTNLIPGYRMEVENHFNPKANVPYIILGSSFSCRQNVQGDADGSVRASVYISAIPFSVPYRPPRIHPKPLIHGVQTAVVCGPSGNEIHCDKFGRVKVQFHWDRINKKDDNSSFWVRVSSAWAGATWGQVSIPRIGQEVIVSFLEGDPDRPIITGRVYNDQQMPPYTLPDNKTQSGIKSRSSTGGSSENFNEFRFEDKKGSEQIYLHAEKDLDELIENKHTITVQKSDQIITLEQGNREITLKKGNEDHTLDMGNHKLVTKIGKIYENGAAEIKMECGGSTITLTPASIELKIGGSTISMNPGMITMNATMIKQN
jgi:type VI secretion system secreted protein VgrG